MMDKITKAKKGNAIQNWQTEGNWRAITTEDYYYYWRYYYWWPVIVDWPIDRTDEEEILLFIEAVLIPNWPQLLWKTIIGMKKKWLLLLIQYEPLVKDNMAN